MPTRSPSVEIEVDDRVVRVSNPDRVYFPEQRGDQARPGGVLPRRRSTGIVNALYERPCMLHRFPKGLSGDKVHQKRLPAGAPPWVETVRLHFPRWNRTADELCVTELASVIWAVQMSTVEFHPWNSRRADTEQPDEWRIDLDPGPSCDFATVRRVAHVAHEVLDELGAVGFPKTSGGNGLHVYVRIRARPRLRRRTPRRARLRPRGRAPGARGRHDHLVAQGPGPAPRVRGLQPERPRPHHRRGVLGARRSRRPRLHPDPLGRGRRRRTRGTSRSSPCPSATPGSGDLHAGIDDDVFDIAPLLEWADRD